MFCLLVQHLLLAILSTWLPQFVLVNAKFNVLVVSPASRLHATHLAWHKNLANIFLRDDRVESVLLLGLVNSLEEEKEKDKRDTIEHGGKLTVWRRNRCGRVKPNCEKEVDKYHSANPIPNPWRKRVEFKMDVSKANTHYLDILMYNDELVNELRAKKFNMGCIEGIGLDGFQQGLLHILGIPNTCMTSSVLPFMPHWQMLGLDEIVKRIPGLDLAKIGNHEEVKRNEENNLKDTEIEKRNRQLIKDHAIISDNTHKLWKEKLTEKYAGQSELLHLVQTLPKMEEMFKQTPVYFVHYQVMMDYPFVEEEYNRHISKLKPKLRYIGGIGMTDADIGEVDNKVVDSKTIRKDIGIGKEPIVLVSFGSVIDMGVRNEEDLEETTDADAEEALFIEDCVAKEEAMLDVFEGFNGQEEGKAHTQFIWKYGNYPKEGPYQKVKENVHGKSWLPQPQILGLGPSEVRAFISHCGLNSVVEAVKAGIPLICIPLFGDQLNNSEGLASREVAIVIDIQTYDDQHKREATHHHHQGETAHQQHQGHKATAGKLNEGDIRKAADAIFSEALIKALKELSVPGNKWATNMAKMRDSFNQLKPTETILKELAALPVPKAHNPKEQSHPNPKHVPIMHSPSRSGHEHDQR